MYLLIVLVLACGNHRRDGMVQISKTKGCLVHAFKNMCFVI